LRPSRQVGERRCSLDPRGPATRGRTAVVLKPRVPRRVNSSLLATLLWWACALCATDAGGASPADSQAFDAQIARLDALDARAPLALEMHLRYADFLATATGENCGARLSAAQLQLASVLKNPALGVVLPTGTARASDIAYQIHLALASCGESGGREQELRTALAAAQRSADLYRDACEYVSMVTMQFNAALAYWSLGESAGAIAVLEQVIDRDREFGFREDAAENYALLLRWRQSESGPEQVAALMQDFPQRSTTLNFAWVLGDTPLTLKTEYTRVLGDAVLHASGMRSVERRVRKRKNHWVVSYRPLAARYRLDALPAQDEIESGFMTSLAGMLLQFHDVDLIGRGGTFGPDFHETTGDAEFSQRVHAEAASLLKSLDEPGSRGAQHSLSLNSALRLGLLPGSVESAAASDYSLETGTWAGASLEQGHWYEMQIALPLAYAPQLFVDHRVKFAFTRTLPCTSGSSAASCVEIVLRAVPDDAELQKLLTQLQRTAHLPRSQALRSWSSFTLRLVTEPQTLQSAVRDIRRYGYLSAADPLGPLVMAETSVIESGPTVGAEE